MNLSKNSKLILVKTAQADGTSAITTTTIDTHGFSGVMIFGSIDTANAGNFAKARQGNAANMSDAADLAGTKVTPASNGDQFLIDIYKPAKRYINVVVTRGASTATQEIFALLYEPSKAPTTHASTVVAETHISPAEGTA